jgi:hypothetical protein
MLNENKSFIRRCLSHFLSLVLAVSTLSAISVFAPLQSSFANQITQSSFDFNTGTAAQVMKTAGNAGPIPASSNFSVESWVYIDSDTNNWQTIMTQNQPDTSCCTGRFYMGFPGGRNLHIGFESGYTDVAVLPLTTWTHIALTLQRDTPSIGVTTVKTYINGVLIQNKTDWPNNTFSSANGFSVGTATNGGYKLNGKIDQVKIWDGVLSQADVERSLSAYAAGGISTGTLRAHYDFNEGTGTTINDRSGISANLTVTAGDSVFSQSPTPPVTTSAAPTNVTVTAGYKQANLSWTAPTFNGGSTITGYTVTSSPLVSAPSACVNTANTSCTFTGLTAGTAYTFTVVAINTKGNSSSSAASSSSTPFGDCSNTPTKSGGFSTVTFTSTSTCNWSVPEGVTSVDVLVVGGGGGGSANRTSTGAGGSGGGGGVYNATSVPVSGSVTVTVGSGGAAGTSANTAPGRSGSQGETSAFGTLTAGGGGGGGCESYVATQGQPCGAGTSIHGRSGTVGGNGGSPSEFWNAYNPGSPGTATGVRIGTVDFAAVTGFRGGFYNDGGSSAGNSAGSAGGAGGAGNLNTPGAGVTSILTGSTVYGRGGSSWNSTTHNLNALAANIGWGGNGGYSASGTATNGIAGSSGIVIVRYVNGDATAAAITTQPTGAASGSVLATQPVIRIVDAGGKTVTNSTVNVVASIASGGGTLSGTTSVAAVNGVATFTNLVITGTSGNRTLTFTPTSLTAVTSNALTISVGAATQVAITRASVGTQRGTAFTTQPQITIQDSGGNTVTSSSAVVTATVSAGGTLVGTTTATASSGVATFTGLGVNGTIGTTYVISYTVGGLGAKLSAVTLTGTTCDGSTFTCQVGDIGPGGGRIFYVAPSFFTQTSATGSMCTTNCKYLEAAPTSGANAWTDGNYTWSGNTNTAIGSTARGTAIGTGFANTLAIVGQSSTANRAATISRAYLGPNSVSDWFLPSRDEFNQMCKWQKGVTGESLNNLNTVCTGSAMNTGTGAAGFTNAWAYWTSTERDASNAQYQYMSNGGQGWDAKSWNFHVRPIRAFGPAPIVISAAAIAGVTAPVAGATPVTTTTAGTGYTGAVTWSGSPTTFATGTIYTATITLTAEAGYTFTGVTENFFTVSGATTDTNPANSGVVTAVFPATAPSNVATLSALTLTTATLSPTFASGTTSYTSTVSNATTSITVTPTRTQSNATITVNGTAATSGSASGSISLNVGSNTITIVVTAQDGTTQSTYTVTVTRQSNDATLSGLTISDVTLSPIFGASTNSYTASVKNSVSTITVTPTRNQANATIQVRVGAGSYASVNSGSASSGLGLSAGSNTVNVLVTAQDGATNTYTITITRAPVISFIDTLTAPTGVAMTAYQGITFSAATGGSGTFTYTYSINNVVNAALPTGLTFNGSSRSITGTPSVAGTTGTIKIIATDTNGDVFTMSTGFSITINSGTQLTLSIVTRFGTGGSPLTLFTSGGSGSGALTYTLDPLVQTSCLLSGSVLTPNFAAGTSGTCYVKAIKAQDLAFTQTSSATTAIFFTAYVPVVQQTLTCPAGTVPSVPTGIGVGSCIQVLAPVSPTAGDAGAAPKISALSATSGLVGATITITGTGFSTVTRVQFGTKSTTVFTATATTITVAVPTGATRGRVMVVSPTGTAMAAQIFTVTIPDTQAPGFTGGSVNTSSPTQITLNFDETIDGTGVLATSFAVSVNGSNRTINSISISGTNIILTLSSAVSAGQTVQFTYTSPGDSTSIKDAAGNKTATITLTGLSNTLS